MTMSTKHLEYARLHIKNLNNVVNILMNYKIGERVIFLYSSNNTLGVEYVQMLIQRFGFYAVCQEVNSNINTLALARQLINKQNITGKIILLTANNYLTAEK